MNTSSGARPSTAAVPHYMRSKTDTLHHSRVHQAPATTIEPLSPPSKGLSSVQESSAKEPGAFCSTYEVSYTPMRARARPESSPAFTGPDHQRAMPDHINQSSLREKHKYIIHKSRDAPPPTAASRYIIDFQHHMRNTAKAEVSRNVRKTEPPNLERIFSNEDEDAISMREIIRRRNEKLKAHDEERLRHRSLLYNKADYAARHGGADAEDSHNHYFTGGSYASSGGGGKEPFADSPQRYRQAFFNQQQFERFAPAGWDRVAQLDHQKRLLERQKGWRPDWAASVSANELAGTLQKGVNRSQFDGNRAQASGVTGNGGVSSVNQTQLSASRHDRTTSSEMISAASAGIENATPTSKPVKATTLGQHSRTLPRAVREQIAQQNVSNDEVMQLVVDPYLKMQLADKQRNWRKEYDRLKVEFSEEANKKALVMKQIKELQKDRGDGHIDVRASSVFLA